MIQIKKTILTLVALLAVTTGAWAADVLNLVVDGTSATIKYDGNANNNPYLGATDWVQSGYDWDMELTIRSTITTVTIDGSCKNFSGSSLHGLFFGFFGLTTINGLDNLNTANVQDMENMFAACSSLTSLDLSSWNTANVTTVFSMFDGCSKLTTVDLSGWNTEKVATISSLFNGCSELTTVDLSSWNTAKVWSTSYMFYNCSKLENIYVGDGWSTAAVTSGDNMFYGCTKLLSMNTANPATNKTNAHTGDGGYLKVKPAAPSGPEVAWDKATKTGTFTMPGGNVTLEPEYYPQATVADGGVTAADADARATTDDPLVKVDATKLTGAKKLMYFVSNSGTTAPAYDAEGWTDQLPTAEGFTQQGIVYVWYYPVGIDEGVDGATATYSDGDICLQSITARIAAAPTYAVTFADGTDPNEWTASPAADVTKGQTVTVTYTGTKKVIGVKAEKKAAAAPKDAKDATAEDLGKVIGADGNIYDDADAATAANTTAVAMIAYVGSETSDDTYTHGLAIALADESGTMNWNTAKSTCEGKSAVTGAKWKLPSQDEWKQMFGANGGNNESYTSLNTAITTAGGTALQEFGNYWSSTPSDEDGAWSVGLSGGGAYWYDDNVDFVNRVRACLAF